MKRNLFLLVAVLGLCSCAVSRKNISPGRDIIGAFTDTAFLNYCLERFDANADERLTFDEVSLIDTVIVNFRGVASLDGIEYFRALHYLDCESNQIARLDMRRNESLAELRCGDNLITRLDVRRNPKLKLLYCSYNKIRQLDVRENPELIFLYCSHNPITSLDVGRNPRLGHLYCAHTLLTDLDTGQNPYLSHLAVPTPRSDRST
jgi:hypothetical protein